MTVRFPTPRRAGKAAVGLSLVLAVGLAVHASADGAPPASAADLNHPSVEPTPASSGEARSVVPLSKPRRAAPTPTSTPTPTPAATHRKKAKPKPRPRPTPTTPTPSTTTTKSNYGGLFGSTEADRKRRGVDHLWLKLKWSDLEPRPGVYDWTPISSRLAANRNLVIRLHVSGGASTPGWLKESAGSVKVSNAKDSFSAEVGQYWTPEYMAAYKRFVSAMGTQFDANPRIASINMFGTSLIYDEPWITGGRASGATLFKAGLDKEKVKAAQNAGLAATVRAFPHTVVEMPLHGQFTYPVAGGQAGKWSDGIGLANAWDRLYGSRVIFTDYGWGAGDYTPAASSLETAPNLYSWMHKRADLGRPIALQATLAPGVAASRARPTAQAATGAGNDALRMGASWFEHHSWSLLTAAQARAIDAGLKANVG